ncbi:restriction endonuclease subunit S [Bacteroides caccae]|uniref:restriction endonuclease subunit S n=1 Tax=Bacteroides caccae TaxID=47678 RepID=UPI0039794D88
MTTTINNEHKKLNVPNLRFPEFQGEWKRTIFKNVITLQRGSSPRPIIEYVTTSDDGVNWIKIGDMPHFGRIVTSTEEKITKEGAKKSRQVNKGDLILSNSMSYGLPYIMGIDGYIHDGWFVLKNFENTFDKDYLCNLLISSAIQNQYKRLAAGGVVQNISSDLVNSVSVSIPTMMEQKKISSLLNLIDERIATQNKIIDKLQSLIKGISSKIFTSIKGVEYRMGDIATITNGNSNVQDAIAESKEGLYPFFDRSEDIKYLPTFLFDKEAIIYPGEGADFVPRYFKGKFALHQRCYAIFDFDEIINAKFLYFYLKTKNSYFIRNAVGSTVPSLRLDTFQKLKVVIPSKNTQYSVSLCLSYIEQKCNLENEVLQTLLKQKQYLLRQMFI